MNVPMEEMRGGMVPPLPREVMQLAGIEFYSSTKLVKTLLERGIAVYSVLYRLTGMDNRRMIPSSKVKPNRFQRRIGQLL